MTKEQVEARKRELETMRQQVVENFQRILGALADCEYWLAEFDKMKDVPNG